MPLQGLPLGEGQINALKLNGRTQAGTQARRRERPHNDTLATRDRAANHTAHLREGRARATSDRCTFTCVTAANIKLNITENRAQIYGTGMR